MIAARLTDIPGSSGWFECGFVTYSNESKMRMLGVDPLLLERHGAVSAEVAAAMATGALERSGADIAVSVTGIAGPGGGTDIKPVGLVYSGCAIKGHNPGIIEHRFEGSRAAIRAAAVDAALTSLLETALLEKGRSL
jgi:nicotinamide-nucleotide amidase